MQFETRDQARRAHIEKRIWNSTVRSQIKHHLRKWPLLTLDDLSRRIKADKRTIEMELNILIRFGKVEQVTPKKARYALVNPKLN